MENTDNQVLFLVMNFAYLEVDGWAATHSACLDLGCASDPPGQASNKPWFSQAILKY